MPPLDERSDPLRSSPSVSEHHELQGRVLKLEEFRQAHVEKHEDDRKTHEKEHKTHEKAHDDHTATKEWVYKKGYVVVGLVATVVAILVSGVLRLFGG